MARCIVHDHVDVEIGQNVSLNLIEELAELPCAVALHAFSNDRSGLYIESGEQGGDAVTLIVMGQPGRGASAAAVACGQAPEFGSHGDLWVKLLGSIES